MSKVTNLDEYRNKELRAVRQELATLPVPRAKYLSELPGFLEGVLTLVVDHGMAFDDAVDIALAVGLDTWIDKQVEAERKYEHLVKLNSSMLDQLAAAHVELDRYRPRAPVDIQLRHQETPYLRTRPESEHQ